MYVDAFKNDKNHRFFVNEFLKYEKFIISGTKLCNHGVKKIKALENLDFFFSSSRTAFKNLKLCDNY